METKFVYKQKKTIRRESRIAVDINFLSIFLLSRINTYILTGTFNQYARLKYKRQTLESKREVVIVFSFAIMIVSLLHRAQTHFINLVRKSKAKKKNNKCLHFGYRKRKTKIRLELYFENRCKYKTTKLKNLFKK